MDSGEAQARLAVALDAAREAGRLTLEYFQRGNYSIDRKADNSPVTEADRRAEQLLRSRLRSAFPDDAVLGEEFGETTGTSGLRWILDPIDGTKSFISGVPLYGTLIGLDREGDHLLGVIHLPALAECAYAARGLGAWYVRRDEPPVPARVSTCSRLADGLFVTSQVDSFARRGSAAAFDRLQAAAGITRTWGDCYGYLLVATGRAVAMVDPLLNLWDAAAVAPILEEAGGSFTDWQGHRTVHAGEGVGTNGRVLPEVLSHLAG